MAIKCDFCDEPAGLHICARCFHIAKQLLETYETQTKVEKQTEEKPLAVAKKRGRPPKERKPEIAKEEKNIVPKKELSKDPALKCWFCEFVLLSGADKGIACSEGKKPETCGHK